MHFLTTVSTLGQFYALLFSFNTSPRHHQFLWISHFSIYQSNRYQFSRAMIGSRNSRYPRLLVDFEAEVKMTGSARAKNRKNTYIVLFL